jgi:uncharacterized protein
MKLYAGTTEEFRADARMHRIAEKLHEYTTQIGHRPAPSEVASWQNSLMALSMLVDQAELNDQSVILDYQLGNTSRRLDPMLTGHSPTSAENAVVVELKQWSDGSIAPSTANNCVELHVGNQVRRVLHPSIQVGDYQQWLLDNHEVCYETDAVALTAVSYLHNHQVDPNGESRARSFKLCGSAGETRSGECRFRPVRSTAERADSARNQSREYRSRDEEC